MLSETCLEAILAIPMPSYELLHPEDEVFREHLYAVLDEFTQLSEKLPFTAGTGKIFPRMALLDREGLAGREWFAERGVEECEFLHVSVAIPLDHYSHLRYGEENSERDTSLRVTIARAEFCKRLSDLLVYANLARLGAIELRSSSLVQDGIHMGSTTIPPMDGLEAQYAAAAAARMNWPPVGPLLISTIHAWARKHNEVIDGFGAMPMSRAIAAFSRLFENTDAPDSIMKLVWAMVGLETLYVRGKGDHIQQVRDKSQVLLGPQETFRKVLSRMYDFRSRFVHGDLGFPDLFLYSDARPEVTKYDQDLVDATSVAIAVLTATIQEVIRRDWSGVSFKYSAHEVGRNAT